MEKSKIIKIAIAVVIGICAIGYYFFNNQETSAYDNVLTSDVIAENTATNTTTEEIEKIKVYVTGEVNSPGVIELEVGSRMEDAIASAGGIKPEANLKDINLAYEVSDGEKIYIPNLSEENSETSEIATQSSGSSSSTNSNSKININKATSSELTSIPGIGASTAEKIIDYRDKNGKFKSVEDIQNVSGIGASKYEKLKDYISVK